MNMGDSQNAGNSLLRRTPFSRDVDLQAARSSI